MRGEVGTCNFCMASMGLPGWFYFNSYAGTVGYVMFIWAVIMWNTADWYVKMLMTSTKLK